MTEHVVVDGKTIRLEAHEPASSNPAPAIVLMHGSGGNIAWWLDRIAPQLTAAGVAIYAPHYFDRTDTVRPDYETIIDGVHFPLWLDTLRATVEHVAQRPAVDPARVALVGVSLGAFLSLGFAAQLSASTKEADHKIIRCIVDLSGGLAEPYRSMATSAFPPTLVVHGEADNIVTPSDAYSLVERLKELHVEHETLFLPNEGHWFSDAAQFPLLMRISSFLSKHLQATAPNASLSKSLSS